MKKDKKNLEIERNRAQAAYDYLKSDYKKRNVEKVTPKDVVQDTLVSFAIIAIFFALCYLLIGNNIY